MSMEYHAVLANGLIPTCDAWQIAMDAFGLPIAFAADFIPTEAKGFCPMKIDGHIAGCEIDFNLEDVASLFEAHKTLKGRFAPSAGIVSFRFGGRYSEGACAFAAAAALVQAFGALFYDPQEDVLFDQADEIAGWARDFLRLAHASELA